jgi:hypothetical protein
MKILKLNLPLPQEPLTKSIAHSAIVLALTVVKAVRVVGYASLDAASHALHASKFLASTPGCVRLLNIHC